MIFADIVSFSRLSSYLDKEIVLNIIYEFINRCKEIIFKYGAVYDKAIGDCVVALVGPPFYTNDSLKNSLIGIKICQEMVKACDYMNEQFQKELFFNNEQFVIGISVGLNTGKVIVGEVGPPGTVDFTALGHEMNLAARIQAHAVKNQILVSQNIFDLVENSGKNKSKLGFYLKEQTPFKPKNMAPENVYSVES